MGAKLCDVKARVSEDFQKRVDKFAELSSINRFVFMRYALEKYNGRDF